MDALHVAFASLNVVFITVDDELEERQRLVKVYGCEKPVNGARSEGVMVKASKILERELTNEEFLIYLQTIGVHLFLNSFLFFTISTTLPRVKPLALHLTL